MFGPERPTHKSTRLEWFCTGVLVGLLLAGLAAHFIGAV